MFVRTGLLVRLARGGPGSRRADSDGTCLPTTGTNNRVHYARLAVVLFLFKLCMMA
jgi:hypothetical protein